MKHLIAIALLAAAPAFGRDVFIAPSGNDSADAFTPGTARRSFAAATALLRPGDVLRLQRGGVWGETLRLPGGQPNRPIRVTAYGGGAMPTIDGNAAKDGNGLDIGIDASASYVSIDSIRVTGIKAPDRGAITVWAGQDLAGISITDCRIEDNAGRGIWIAGEAGKSVSWVYIDRNTVARNAGCGVLATKINFGWITRNDLPGNCQKTVDAWQAAVRVWSNDVRGLWIGDNKIDNGLYHLDRGAGMGVHVDETGDSVFVVGNDIRHCDASGIEVENARGVTVKYNTIFDVDTGIFVYRAGHDHRIERNSILARSLGIVLQGWLAHGVDAGPELRVNDQLLTGNVIAGNAVQADKWASLKLVGGGERLTGPAANVIRDNAIGPERAEGVELGDRRLSNQADLEGAQILGTKVGPIPFSETRTGDLKLPREWQSFGAPQITKTPQNPAN